MKRTLCLAAASIGTAVFLGGCETPAATSPAVPRSAAQADEIIIPPAKVNAIAKGMSTAQLEQLLGGPTRKTPFPGDGNKAEVWTYRLSSSETVSRVAVEMRDVPTFDPLTGRMIDHKEPVYQNQHVRVYRTVELLIVNGRLTERKPGSDVERFFQ